VLTPCVGENFLRVGIIGEIQETVIGEKVCVGTLIHGEWSRKLGVGKNFLGG